jgi:hypothetical protein
MATVDPKLMDAIMDSLDDQLLAGHFDLVDNHLQGFRIENFSAAEMLCTLTITHAARKQLIYYKDFYTRVKLELLNRGKKNVDELMKGLE